MELFRREDYLRRIRGFYDDTGLIKVITGVRRCGKSCLMQTIGEELQERGISEENVIFIDLDARPYNKVKTAAQLEEAIETAASEAFGTKYLFIDEIQNVEGFEEVVNTFRNDGDFSVFITGSNSYLLSGELVTKLTGRYIEFEVQTLNFQEYCEMKQFYGQQLDSDLVSEFDSYIVEGGFPKTLEYESEQDKRTYVQSVVKEIFEKDIRRRVMIRNFAVFEQVQTYIINNFGSLVSLPNILDDLERQGMNIKRTTLDRYLRILEDAKIIRKCTRFDLKSRRSIGAEQKYYLADLAFYFSTNTDNRINYGPALENIVYNYALSRDYKASVGRIGKLECDFVLRSPQSSYAYVQVAMTIADSKETEDREYRPLEKIKDNYPKYVMTRNDPIQHRNGVEHVNIMDFIMEGRDF